MDDPVKQFLRERSAAYGALAGSSLTAIAMQKALDRIEELEQQLANPPSPQSRPGHPESP